MELVPEELIAELTSHKPTLTYYVMIKPFNASYILELGFLSLAVECLLIKCSTLYGAEGEKQEK